MIAAIRWVVVTVLSVHGLIHFLGVAKGFGGADVAALTAPIGPRGAVAWLVAGILVLIAAAMVGAGAPAWWWVPAAVAAVVSQAVILGSWQDAKAGTAANVLLLLVAGYGFASAGPVSLHHVWSERAAAALAAAPPAGPRLLTEPDLADLPAPVATYIRRSGAVGQPKVVNFSATVRGRIRGGPGSPWMTFTGRQLNTYGEVPRRIFLMDAVRAGLPVTVVHVFDDRGASMRGRAVSLVPILDAAGPVMDRSETVTLFNDLVVFAPAALADAPVDWTPLDAHRVRARYTRGAETITAELVFGDDGDLVDFVSDDRSRASQDGRSFTRLRWHTPLTAYREVRGRHLPVAGEARWYAAEPEGHFPYIEFAVDDVAFNVTAPGLPPATAANRPGAAAHW